MKNASFAIVAALAVGLVSAASAQEGQIPTWANPTPDNPIATDGTALARHGFVARPVDASAYLSLVERGARAPSATIGGQSVGHGRVISAWGHEFTVD